MLKFSVNCSQSFSTTTNNFPFALSLGYERTNDTLHKVVSEKPSDLEQHFTLLKMDGGGIAV